MSDAPRELTHRQVAHALVAEFARRDQGRPDSEPKNLLMLEAVIELALRDAEARGRAAARAGAGARVGPGGDRGRGCQGVAEDVAAAIRARGG